MQRDEMGVEAPGQTDGHVETGDDRLAGIAMDQDRIVGDGGLRIGLDATYEQRTSSGLI
jgi:hypothetical protein